MQSKMSKFQSSNIQNEQRSFCVDIRIKMRTKETVVAETAQNFDTHTIKTPPLTEFRRSKIKFYVQESQSTAEYRNMFGPIGSPRWIKNLVKFLQHPKIDKNVISIWLYNNPLLAPVGQKITRIRKMPKRFEKDDFREAFETQIKSLTDEVDTTVPEKEVQKEKTTGEMSPTDEDTNIKGDSPENNPPLPKLQLVSHAEPKEYFVPWESDDSKDLPKTKEQLTVPTTKNMEINPHRSIAQQRRPNSFPFLLNLNKNSEIITLDKPVKRSNQQNGNENVEEDLFSDDSVVTTKIPGRKVQVELMDLQITDDADSDQQFDWCDDFLGSAPNPSPVLTPQSPYSIPVIDLIMSEEQDISLEPTISFELHTESSEMETTDDVNFQNPTTNNMSSDSEEIDVVNMEEIPSPPYEPIFPSGNISVLRYFQASSINVAHGLLKMANDLSEQQRNSESWQSSLRNTDADVVHAITNIENFFSHIKTSLDIIMRSINRASQFPRE